MFYDMSIIVYVLKNIILLRLESCIVEKINTIQSYVWRMEMKDKMI